MQKTDGSSDCLKEKVHITEMSLDVLKKPRFQDSEFEIGTLLVNTDDYTKGVLAPRGVLQFGVFHCVRPVVLDGHGLEGVEE